MEKHCLLLLLNNPRLSKVDNSEQSRRVRTLLKKTKECSIDDRNQNRSSCVFCLTLEVWGCSCVCTYTVYVLVNRCPINRSFFKLVYSLVIYESSLLLLSLLCPWWSAAATSDDGTKNST